MNGRAFDALGVETEDELKRQDAATEQQRARNKQPVRRRRAWMTQTGWSGGGGGGGVQSTVSVKKHFIG